jgi:very-short-patch-repair endonuclease
MERSLIVRGLRHTHPVSGWPWSINIVQQDNVPLVVSERTVRAALEGALMTYTKDDLRIVLSEELRLVPRDELPPEDWSKREHIRSVTQDWSLAQLINLSQRVVDRPDVQVGQLPDLIAAYRRSSGGVVGGVKNLIFAANGPKPELVLRDAVSNDVEITRNAQFCLIYDRPIGAEGLSFQALIDWWRDRESIGAEVADREVGHGLYARLQASIGDNPVELLVFRTYFKRYAGGRFDIPALIPQVYLHYDPLTRRARGESGSPLPRQRMDFLLLYSDRSRVVIEVDGRQHYSDEAGQASPRLYSEMVAEDRRLQLAGYDVYRFGGHELVAPAAERTVATFLNDLHEKMA